jgi:hypothetical protein
MTAECNAPGEKLLETGLDFFATVPDDVPVPTLSCLSVFSHAHVTGPGW